MGKALKSTNRRMTSLKNEIKKMKADLEGVKGGRNLKAVKRRSMSSPNLYHIKHEELVKEIFDLRQRFDQREGTPMTPREEILSALRSEMATLRREYEALNEHQKATDQRMVEE